MVTVKKKKNTSKYPSNEEAKHSVDKLSLFRFILLNPHLLSYNINGFLLQRSAV